jgi:hypothetical protein
MTMIEPFQQLHDRMVQEIKAGHPYEAFQLGESFIARKHKALGKDMTSQLVFHGCKILIESGASGEAGSLLAWFIEQGAGDDYYFNLNNSEANGPEFYCDSIRLTDLLSSLTPVQAHPVVEKVYGPIHKMMLKKTVTGALAGRMNQLELRWVDIFESCKNWSNAYKATVRMGDMSRAARILDSWAKDGYASEQPLFFARALLVLLSDGHLQKANDLLACAKSSVDDDSETNTKGPRAASLVCYHFAVILTELASMAPKPRVDKQRIFNILCERYHVQINRVDPKIPLLYEKLGQNAFGIRPVGADAPNPMAAMFQSMLANNPAPGKKGKKSKAAAPAGLPGLPPGMDFDAMVKALEAMK